MKKLNYFNDNTVDILVRYTKSDIMSYYRELVYWTEYTDDEALIQSRFKSNRKYVEETYPECTV